MRTDTLESRLDYLDGVRAFALLLGIIFHAGLSFMPVFIGWAVMDVSTSDIVSVFALVSHSFRMELFFLIAGFFGHMTLHKKGVSEFLKSRALRILLPFVVAWFFIRPLLVSGWVMGAESLRGDVNIVSGLVAGFQSLSTFPNGIFTGTHLWFLYYLLLVTLCMLAMRGVFMQKIFTDLDLAGKVDALVEWLCRSRFVIFLLSVPVACTIWFMSQWGMDTPDKSLTPHIPVFLIYFGFFAFGWLLHRRGDLIKHFATLSKLKIIVCVISIVASVILSGYSMNTGHTYYFILKAAFCLNYALMMWSLVMLSIGVFEKLIKGPNKAVRYIADASYWLYLIHLPIVVFLQIAFAELSLHWSIKLFAISGITIIGSLLIYDLCIRNTFIGMILNGRKRSSCLMRAR